MKVRVKNKFMPSVEELFRDGELVIEDAEVARFLGRTFVPMRTNGQLHIGYDRRNGTTIAKITCKYKAKKRKRGLFEILL